jgi:hypothetical protein
MTRFPNERVSQLWGFPANPMQRDELLGLRVDRQDFVPESLAPPFGIAEQRESAPNVASLERELPEIVGRARASFRAEIGERGEHAFGLGEVALGVDEQVTEGDAIEHFAEDGTCFAVECERVLVKLDRLVHVAASERDSRCLSLRTGADAHVAVVEDGGDVVARFVELPVLSKSFRLHQRRHRIRWRQREAKARLAFLAAAEDSQSRRVLWHLHPQLSSTLNRRAPRGKARISRRHDELGVLRSIDPKPQLSILWELAHRAGPDLGATGVVDSERRQNLGPSRRISIAGASDGGQRQRYDR